MKTPYGKTVAGVKLAEMVKDNSKARSYVSSTLSQLNGILVQLFQIRDNRTRRLLCMMIRREFEQRISQASGLDMKIYSYLRNVIQTNCKIFKRNADKTYS